MKSRAHLLAGIVLAMAASLTACRADGLIAPLALEPAPVPAVLTSLHGHVGTAGANGPLAGANAMLLSTDGRVLESTLTDEWGRYAFTSVPAGSYRLRVRAIGYKPSVIEPLTIDASTMSLPTVTMKRDPMMLTCGLVVVGAKKR